MLRTDDTVGLVDQRHSVSDEAKFAVLVQCRDQSPDMRWLGDIVRVEAQDDLASGRLDAAVGGGGSAEIGRIDDQPDARIATRQFLEDRVLAVPSSTMMSSRSLKSWVRMLLTAASRKRWSV